MKNIVLALSCAMTLVYACKQEDKKTTSASIQGYQEMQQVVTEFEKGLDSLHAYQGAIRDMLHSFEASFPKDTFATKLRTQLSELNKAEYMYNEWKKTYGINWDTLKTDKAAFAMIGKNDITAAKEAQLYNIKTSKQLIAALKRAGVHVANDPTVTK